MFAAAADGEACGEGFIPSHRLDLFVATDGVLFVSTTTYKKVASSREDRFEYSGEMEHA